MQIDMVLILESSSGQDSKGRLTEGRENSKKTKNKLEVVV